MRQLYRGGSLKVTYTGMKELLGSLVGGLMVAYGAVLSLVLLTSCALGGQARFDGVSLFLLGLFTLVGAANIAKNLYE